MERVRRKSSRPEDAIQRAVFQHLRQRKARGVFAFHVPNGGKRSPIEASIMKGLGVTAGVPDIIALVPYRSYGDPDGPIFATTVCALELKAEGGRVSPKQIETMEAMRAAGAVVDVTYGLDAALRWLEQHQILVGRST